MEFRIWPKHFPSLNFSIILCNTVLILYLYGIYNIFLKLSLQVSYCQNVYANSCQLLVVFLLKPVKRFNTDILALYTWWAKSNSQSQLDYMCWWIYTSFDLLNHIHSSRSSLSGAENSFCLVIYIYYFSNISLLQYANNLNKLVLDAYSPGCIAAV